MTKDEMLDILVQRFASESPQWQRQEIPIDVHGKRLMLRAMMNVRVPAPVAEDTIVIQDDYLKERASERGITYLEDIEPISKKYKSQIPHADKIAIWQGDITLIECDAIVNAANSQMLGCFAPLHACIDNCIHTYAGVQLRQECAAQMDKLRDKHGAGYEQPTAVPMITEAYNLPSRRVIHIVGPIVSGALTEEHEMDLRNCYLRTLDMCKENGLRSVAFCCISTGVFHFPADRAAKIAIDTVTEWLDENSDAIDTVIFNVFGDTDKDIYERLV